MDKSKNNKIIISTSDLLDFADKLIRYGKEMDYPIAENTGIGLKAFFFDDSEKAKNSFKDFYGGLVEYKEK